MVGSIRSKERIDLLLVKKGLAPTRTRARALIMAGVVFVNGARVDKAGTLVEEDAEIVLKDFALGYVSRGGIKLEAALKKFKIDVSDKVVLDIGASTGGFTDCLLKHGAKKVYAVDVGYGQLDWKLRQDPRVVVMERINARYLKPENIGELVDVSTIDVSFISLTKVIPSVSKILKPGGILIALIKPQFEVGKGEVGKGGIVIDENKHGEVVNRITYFLEELNFKVLGVIPSPILGADGNKEFLVGGVLL
ncbi:MAG TPA: TlyA family RNA methyltransferase [Thermodesulfobacteriota bacterium]|nr:TlyA family RNA methyltransferase [Thermodesulfobacteriota bacterium]